MSTQEDPETDATKYVADNPIGITSSDSAENLISRLKAVRERLFWLQACWATTLSPAIAWEADRFRKLDADALDTLIAGYKALLLTEPTTKPDGCIPDGLQSLV